MGSLSSENALAHSAPLINSSKRWVYLGSVGSRLDKGEISTGCMVTKVGWISLSSTYSSKTSAMISPMECLSSTSTCSFFAASCASARSVITSKLTPVCSSTKSTILARLKGAANEISCPSYSTVSVSRISFAKNPYNASTIFITSS